MGLSSASNAGCSISLTSFLSVLAPWVVSAHLPALKTMGAYDFQMFFFFPSCVFSLDLYSHRHSITVLNVQQPSKMFYFRLIHWHEFDLISSFKVVYPLSRWIRHMWVSWFSFSACSQQSYVFPHFQMKNKGATLHSSLSQTTSNPSAKSFGFTFKLYLHFHHFSIHCLISNWKHSYLFWLTRVDPPGLPASTIENQYHVKYSYYMLSNNTYEAHILWCALC